MENVSFTCPDPKISIWSRLRTRIVGFRDRKGVLRSFLRENNISRIDSSISAATRRTYLMKTHYTEELADLRDKMIQQRITTLSRLQHDISDRISHLNTDIINQTTSHDVLKSELSNIILELKQKAITPLQSIHLQANRGTLEASIENQKATITSTEAEISRLTSIKNENIKLLNRCFNAIDNKFEEIANTYITSAGRLLHKAGHTNFDAELRDYNNDIQNQIEELSHDK